MNIYLLRFACCLSLLFLLLFSTYPSKADELPDYFKHRKGKFATAYRCYEIQKYELAEKLLQELRHTKKLGPKKLYAVKLLLARVYLEMKEYGTSRSVYQSIAADKNYALPSKDVCDYIYLLRRSGANTEAIEIAYRYKKVMGKNQRFLNQVNALQSYYQYYGNRDTLNALLSLDTLNVNMPNSYTYGFQLYKDGFLFLANPIDIQKRKSFYVNTKLYQYTEEQGVRPFENLKNVLQYGPVSFYNGDSSMIYTDNQYRALNTGNRPYRQQNNLQLYSARLKDEARWTKPRRISGAFMKHAEKYSFLHPSVVQTDSLLRLFFASDMPGGYGGTDLYFSDYNQKKKRWSKPINLGRGVNTNGDELFPTVAQDTLIFSSNGLLGYGGHDLYMSSVEKRQQTPFHFPFPVNSQFDDISMSRDRENGMLYFSSDRGAQPDLLTLTRLFKLKMNLSMEEMVALANKPTEKKTSDQHLPKSLAVIDLVEVPIETANTILFELNNASLADKALGRLDVIYNQWINRQQDMICIEGHADETGLETHNLKLSEKRAQSIKKYLVKKGVPEHKVRLTWYGSLRPLSSSVAASQLSAVQRERINTLNRRSEVTICTLTQN